MKSRGNPGPALEFSRRPAALVCRARERIGVTGTVGLVRTLPRRYHGVVNPGCRAAPVLFVI
jgi:hypothetical protein